MRVVEFTYKVSDILREVTKRTSYLGRMRNTDQDVHLLDRLSLTEGEKFMFSEYIQEAAAETYNYMQAFGRKIVLPYRIYDDKPLYTVKENCGVHTVKDDEEYGLELVVPATDWGFEVLHPTFFDVSFEPFSMYIGDASQFKWHFKMRYTVTATSTIDGQTLSVTKEKEYEQPEQTSTTNILNLNEAVFTGVDTSIDYGTNPTITEVNLLLQITSITPATPLVVQPGEYVDQEMREGFVMHYKAHREYNSGTEMWEFTPRYFELLGGDWRDSVVYQLDMECWQDPGMFPVIDNRIKEALVSYVIWRWFETVLPREADIYEKKWKDKAYEIQMGLNSEGKKLHRRYKYF